MRALHILTALLFLLGVSLTGCDSDGIGSASNCSSTHPRCDDGGGSSDDDGGGSDDDDGGLGDDDDGGGDDDDGGSGDDDGGGGDEVSVLHLDPTATYLRAGAGTPYATAYPLADLGLTAGEPACFLARGDLALGDGTTSTERGVPLVLAVFSASDFLDAPAQRYRVKDALEAGDDVETPLTVPDDRITDVDQDFDATDACVTVPYDAEFVFFSQPSTATSQTTSPSATTASGSSRSRCADGDAQIRACARGPRSARRASPSAARSSPASARP